MQNLQHRFTRQNDKTILSAQWRDGQKRPAAVEIKLLKGEMAPLPDQVPDMLEGDVKDVTGVMFGLADIAWSMGWRPRGLMGTVAHTIEAYKLPPDVRR